MSTAKQFNRIVEFNSTQPIIGNSGGAVYIAGGLNVSNLNVSNNVTIANLTITNNLFTSTGSTLLSSQWVNVAAGIAFTSGNVGVGTTTPGFTLDVSGGARITGGLTTGTLNIVSGASIPNLLSSVITTSSLLATNFINSTNITSTNLVASFTSLGNLTSLTGTFANKVGGSQTVGTILVTTSASLIGNTNTIGNLFTTGGNVGINTTSPGVTFDVIGTGRFTNLFASFTSLGNLTSSTGTFANKVGGSQTVGTLVITTSASLIGNTNTIGNLFTTGGNVGINTTSPGFTLDVIGTGRFTNLTSTTNTIGTLNNTNLISTNSSVSSLNVVNLLSTNNTITNLIASSQTVGSILVITNANLSGNSNTVGSIFTTGGNVGINTTSPNFTLDILGTLRITNSLTTGSIYSTNMTTINLVGTTSTIPNLNTTNITTTSLITTNLISNLITVNSLLATTNISTSNVFSTNNTLTNLISTTSTLTNLIYTNATGTSLNLTGLSTINSSTTNFTTSNLLSTNNTLTNIVSTTATIPNIIHTNITTTSILSSGPSNLNFSSNTLGNIFTTGGNVGINTGAPFEILHVNGNIRSTGYTYVNSGTLTTGSAGTVLFATGNSGLYSGRFHVNAVGGGGHSSFTIDVSGTFTENFNIQTPTISVKRSQWNGGTNVSNVTICTAPANGTYISTFFLTCATGTSLTVTLLERENQNTDITLNTLALTTLTAGYSQLVYPLNNTVILQGGMGNYLNVNNVGVGINTTGGSYTLDINGTIARSGIRLPRFDNGTFTTASAAIIPILFSDSTYNYVEIKVRFVVSTLCNVVLNGSTSSNGSSPFGGNEIGETLVKYNSQASPIYTNLGYIAQSCEVLNIDNNFTIKIIRSTGGGRNHYSFDTIYTVSGVGTGRVYGMGHLDTASNLSTQLLSILMTPSTGTITGTWSTQHSY